MVPASSAASSWEPAGSARPASSIARSGERRHLEEAALAAAIAEQIEHFRRRGQWEKLQCVELLFVRGWSNKETARQAGHRRADGRQLQVRVRCQAAYGRPLARIAGGGLSGVVPVADRKLRPFTNPSTITIAICCLLSTIHNPPSTRPMFRPSDLGSVPRRGVAAGGDGADREGRPRGPRLVEQLATVHARRNAGVHSLGEIWRQHRLSCPSREQLGSFLLGAVPEAFADYVTFHAKVIGCRYCQANLIDLQSQQAGREPIAHSRRRKYFQSSAGYLKKEHSR